MRDLTPSYVPETGEVILDGPCAGPAGEAGLVPVAGVELAFDRADGHLVRAIVDVACAPAIALVSRLFGAPAAKVICDLADPAKGAQPHAVSPVGGFCAPLSRLARLDAARTTSPVPGSPWWAAEAVVLVEQAGLHSRTLTEAGWTNCAPRGGPPQWSCRPEMDVAAEVAELANDCLPGLHWVLEPIVASPELFRPGLTPHSDLLVHRDTGSDSVIVQAALAPGADPAAAERWHARLVDPTRRLVLDLGGFRLAGSRVQADLHFPVDGPEQAWIEVVDDPERPVRDARAHWIQRALRWADAALRAERAPAGIAPRATPADWAALAEIAWDRCRHDWRAAGDHARAAAVLVSRMPAPGPVCLAEILGE
jgi:hypothetical protein